MNKSSSHIPHPSKRASLAHTAKGGAQAKVEVAEEFGSGFVRMALITLISFAMLALSWSLAKATEIQKVISPSGIEAWLVEDHTVPIIAMDFSFSGGTTQDAQDKQGGVNLLTTLFDEGAGDLKAKEFQSILEEKAIKISFDAGRDRFYGSFRTLTPYRDEAFDLLALAVQSPRLDADPLERMRTALLSGLERAKTNPSDILSKTFRKEAYGSHPYGLAASGEIETLKAVTRDDLLALHKKILTRDDLTIGVVGAIDAKTLASLLDKVFAALPEKGELTVIPDTKLTAKGSVHVPFNAPQMAIRFAMPGIKRHDKDFYAAYLVNHILGGGSFSSRLYEEIREKRGLVYGVYSYLVDYDHAALFGGGMGTGAENTPQALALAKAEIARMAKEGPTKTELENAKKYLIGSYPLRFDSSSKIARQLVGVQDQKLGMDYFDKRNSYIEAVTLEDTKRVAAKLLNPDNLLVITVGPEVKTADAGAKDASKASSTN
ncbi:MAG: insulinase family protein [Cohaesibacter sp.]|jgi:zinc protease|nr:insulinase family protein [Cohaesibacter sp.]